MTPETDAPNPLEYARHRPRPWRSLGIAIVAVVALAGAWHLFPIVATRIDHVRWQQRVATFSVPPGTVAYEMNSELVVTPDVPGSGLPRPPLPGDPNYVHDPASPFNGPGGLDTRLAACPWDHYEPPTPLSFASPRSTAVVFCHDRTAACGRRIVFVVCHLERTTGESWASGKHYGALPNQWSAELQLLGSSVRPASLTGDEQPQPPGPHSFLAFDLPRRGCLRVNFGQVDPADAGV